MSSSVNLKAIIESITCPLTLEPMREPVSAPDGQTYEKESIIRWLNEKGISPHDRRNMNVNQLQVNAAIRFLCDKYHNGDFGSIEIPKNTKISNDNIKMECTTNKTSENNNIMLTFKIDRTTMSCLHLSQDVIIVIDRSGSMGTTATTQDEKGDTLENGWTVQDIVNHAACTIVKTLDNNSRVSIIAFDHVIEEIVPLTLMSEINKTTIIAKIKQIKPRGQTNLWGGIDYAINVLDERNDKSRNGNILALTDGTPNISPAYGEVYTIKRLRKTKNFTAPIYTFGFGYNLQRGLLYEIAKAANGGNGHISDGGMIATVFCNFIATILTTIAVNLQLNIKTKSGNSISPEFMLGDYEYNSCSNNINYVFDIGTVQLEQYRNIIMNINPNEEYEYFYTYKIGGKSYKSETYLINKEIIEKINEDFNVEIHKNRYDVVNSIRKIINYNNMSGFVETENILKQIEKQLEELKSNDVLTQGMLKNIKGDEKNQGQIRMAATNETYFKKWGEYYLDQVSRSMNIQQKPNFKDSGMPFGGDIFDELVDKASDNFNSLPPPESSLIYTKTKSAPPVKMSAFNNIDGGCFDSNCTITMADGSTKILKNLEKGDKILSCDLNNVLQIATIKCILEIKVTFGIRELVDFEGGLYITPWHPIKYNNKWQFPANIKAPMIKSCDSIITLVLDNHHIGFINGYQCIMLGHEYENGILNHPYYGTKAIINDMKSNHGWIHGKVILNDTSISLIKLNEITSSIKMESSTTRVY
tara:strand:- start:1442 stop:3709 length:2268 start_codon:yes stop_codon:yes gene_type:complete